MKKGRKVSGRKCLCQFIEHLTYCKNRIYTMLPLLWLLKCQWVFWLWVLQTLLCWAQQALPHPHTIWMPLSSNDRNLLRWKMRAAVIRLFMPLNQHSSIDPIMFKCDYIWGSDCQGNTSGNLFCLCTTHFLLLCSWAVVGYILQSQVHVHPAPSKDVAKILLSS